MQYLIAFCCRPEATSNVISGADVGQVGVDVGPQKTIGNSRRGYRFKLGDFRSNNSRDIRLPHFVANDDMGLGGVLPYCHRVRRPAPSLSLVTK